MNEPPLKKEVVGILIAILFLTLGFLALWLMKAMLSMEQDAVLVAMLLIPVLVYMILTGRIREFSAGGIKAVLGDIAQAPLVEKSAEPITAEKVQEIMVHGAGMLELQKEVRAIDESMTVVLTVTCRTAEPYDAKDLLKYLKVLSRYHKFRFLVILSQNKRVVAYMSNWQAKEALDPKTDPDGFVQAIQLGSEEDLEHYGAISITVENTDTLFTALRKMTDHNMRAIVVVDKNRMLQGVIEREQVLSRLLLAMVQ